MRVKWLMVLCLLFIFVVYGSPTAVSAGVNDDHRRSQKPLRMLDLVRNPGKVHQDWVGHKTAPRVSETEGAFTIEIQTVPALEGIQFVIDEEVFMSDEDGRVEISLEREGVRNLAVQNYELFQDDMRLEFARWSDGVFTPTRELDLSANISLEVGFHVSYPATLEFVDLDGNLIPPSRVTSVEIRNNLGDVHTFPGDQVYWMQSGNLLGRDYGLELVDIVQTVQAVTIDGSNVVNRGQQRFVLLPDENPRIEVLLYPAQFKTIDAFIGFQLGRGILLEYPDGQEIVYTYGEDKTLQLDSLARGTYRFKAVGVLGYVPMTVFVLSQPQEVTSIVVSVWDFLLVLGLGLIIFPGLLIAGRPEIRSKILALRRKGKQIED